jgi:hypothetical protein
MFKFDTFIVKAGLWARDGLFDLDQIVDRYRLNPIIIPAWDRDGVSEWITKECSLPYIYNFN